MSKNDHEALQREIEKKLNRRQAKKKPRMKISGAGVKKLQRLIIDKARKNS